MSFISLVARIERYPETNTFRIGIEPKVIVFKPPLAALQKLGWAYGTKLDVQVGEGDDVGKVRFVTNPKGWSLIKAGGSATSLALKLRKQSLPGAPGERRPSVSVRHELDGETAIIAWLPWIQDAAPRVLIDQHTADDAGSGGNVGVVTDPPVAGREGHQHAGSGEEPVDTPHVLETAPAGDHCDSNSVGSIPTSGSNPGEQRTPSFPIQERSLAEVIARTNDPATWPAEVRAEFIEAAGRRRPLKELARICGRNDGSIVYIINRYLKEQVAAKRQEYGTVEHVSVEHQFKPMAAPPREPPKPSPAPAPMRMVPRAIEPAAEQSAKPTLSPALLKFLRDEVWPVLAPLGRVVKKNDDDTGFLMDGKPATVAEIIAETNRVLRLNGDDEITFDTAAAA